MGAVVGDLRGSLSCLSSCTCLEELHSNTHILRERSGSTERDENWKRVWPLQLHVDKSDADARVRRRRRLTLRDLAGTALELLLCAAASASPITHELLYHQRRHQPRVNRRRRRHRRSQIPCHRKLSHNHELTNTSGGATSDELLARYP